MSNNNTVDLSELYKGIQNEMMASLELNSILSHPTIKGDYTENNWVDFFRTYLPKRYKVDSGIVIDSKGYKSEQIDIIIYDTQYSYFVFREVHNSKETLYIPAESVYAVFEVKQQLKNKFKDAGKKAASVRSLFRTSAPIKHAGGYYEPKELHEIVAGLIATKSGWKEPSKQDNVIKNVINNLNKRSYLERLDLVCSIDSCSFSVKNNTFIKDYNSNEKYDIEFCKPEHTLIYLLLSLFQKLQDIGTVPAIIITEYMKHITTDNIPQIIDNE